MKCSNYYAKPVMIVPIFAWLCFLFVRGVVIAQNLNPPHHDDQNGNADPVAISTFCDPEHVGTGKSVTDALKWMGMDSSEAHERLQKLRQMVAKKEEEESQQSRTHQAVLSTKKKISGLQWGIPQHPALVEIANQDTSHLHFDNQLALAYHRGLVERNWETMGSDVYGDFANDQFGFYVSMSADGMRVAIGAEGNNGADGNQQNAGQVRVFQYNGGSSTWNQLGQDIYGAAGSRSGRAISISGDGKRLAIGAPYQSGTATGKVRVYEYDDSSDVWSPLGNDLDPGGSGTVQYGDSVSLSYDGKRVAIGAPFHNSNTGYAQVFEYNEGWAKLGQDIVAEAAADQAGRSVSLSRNGDRVAVGSSGNDGSFNLAGHVRVFEYDSTDWVQLGNDIDGEGENDYSGFVTSLSDDGHRLAIGVRFNDGAGGATANAGHVRVFEYNGSDWDQMGNDIDGIAVEDKNGASVSLSADGRQVVIGAPGVSSSRGYVRVFQYSGSTWQQLGLEMNGERNLDQCGWSVSMSGSGDHLAIGCPAVGHSTNIGYVQFYELPALPAIFDLAVSLDSVAISLTNNTDFSEAIVFQYSYSGNTRGEDPRLSFTYDIRKGDCETPFAPHGNKSMALYFNDFDDETIENKTIAKLGINLTTIEDARDVWFQDNGETQAVLKFCGVWNIFVENVLFQFHESNVTASINLKEDGGFTVDELDVGLDRQDANALAEDVEVQFPLDVFMCDDDGDTTDLPSGGFTQGDVIQVCIKVKNTTTADVYVEGIDKMMYSATEVNTTVTLIDNGNLQYGSTAKFDCSHDGICNIMFVAMAGMYVNTANNILYTEGFATIAFGADPDARRRRMAFTGHTESTRHMQEDDGAAVELAPFEFAVGNLQPSSSGLESVSGTEYGIVIWVVLGIAAMVVVAAVVAAAFFVYRRRQPVVEAEGLDKDATEEDCSSSAAQSAGQSSLLETNGSDCYEIVEV